ncbi:expressed unknown protein [Seminavis robusta]|uniref:Uncharacterized protein n=1 Tax=Seminavis robusta TaxID=568900 RepID=A0A9N8DQB5_9STRA|nr:expressed unknown protein [Seminavis robusta]|eukprot:Sro271_g104450.1 n/a (341) ;mRNA; f:13702-14724
MGWLNSLFQKGRSKDDTAAMTNSFFFGSFQPIEFHVINELNKPINITVFNEDPVEIGPEEEDEEEEEEGSDLFNGFEPISIQNGVLPGQEWAYRRTCACMDCHIGTIKVDSIDGGRSFYVDGQKCHDKDPSLSVVKTLNDEETVNFDVSLRGSAWKEEEDEEIMTIEIQQNEETGFVVVDLILEYKAKKMLKGHLPSEVRFSQHTLEASVAMLECNFRFNGAQPSKASQHTIASAKKRLSDSSSARRTSGVSIASAARKRSSDASMSVMSFAESVCSKATVGTHGTVTSISQSTRSRRGRKKKHSRRRKTSLGLFLEQQQQQAPPPNDRTLQQAIMDKYT